MPPGPPRKKPPEDRGSARAFRKTPWKTVPAKANPPPAIPARSILGRRILKRMRAWMGSAENWRGKRRDRKVRTTSPGGISAAPREAERGMTKRSRRKRLPPNTGPGIRKVYDPKRAFKVSSPSMSRGPWRTMVFSSTSKTRPPFTAESSR